jgi:hypothetical protein
MQKGQLTMRKSVSSFLFLVLFASFLFAFSKPAMADDDPPGRVARLNYIQGSVSFQPGGETDWVQANPNRPLTTGDNLWADRNSRGELHIGSTTIRLSAETGISFLNLDDRTVQIQLAQGSMNVHVRRLDGGDAFEIDTPNLAFTLQRPGEYRVDVDPNGNATIITVREGEGEATGGGSSFHLDSGDRTRFSGTDSLTFDEGRAGRPDEFDRWCRSRDDREEHAQSARYVSRDVIGYEDLDEHGEWRNVPEYGYVWFPAGVEAGWAPYRFGHWVWIAPWGWTWVEDEPWGFAPFHYGRWAVVGRDWCWVPGPVVVRPVYAPALVAFVGGSRFSMSLAIGGGGGVAWFPLGPREVYVPNYRSSQRYVQNVNITNTTVNVVNVTNVYNNVNVNNVTYMHQNNVAAVTAVSHDTFVNARSVRSANVRVNPQQLQSAEIQRGNSVAPVRTSVVGSGAPTTVRPPESVMSRQVVVKEAPPTPRGSFERNQQAQQPSQPGRVPPQQTQQQPMQQQQQQRQHEQQPQIQSRPGQPQPMQQPPQQQQPQREQQPQFQPRPGQPQPTQQPPQQQQPQREQQPQFQPRPGQSQPTQQPPQQQQPQREQQPQFQPRPGQSQPTQQPPQQQQPQREQQPQFQSRPGQSQPTQQPPQQQQPQREQQPQFQPRPGQSQPTQQPQQQQQRPQMDQTRKPPEQQNPAVKFAPPAKANEDTYRPHQFEKPQNAPPPKTATEQQTAPERGQERGQSQGQEPGKSGNGEKDRKESK